MSLSFLRAFNKAFTFYSLMQQQGDEDLSPRPLFFLDWNAARLLKIVSLTLFLLFSLLGAIFAETNTTSLVLRDVPEPSDYRLQDYKSPVPKTLKGARVLSSGEAEKLFTTQSSIFIDVNPRPPRPVLLPEGTVWRDVPHSSIERAYWLPNVGYGVLTAEVEYYFKSRLEQLTQNNKNHSVVFFCLKECWMSWNAAKRAVSWGYSTISWFPEGTDGWQMLGYSLVPVEPVP